MDPKDIDDVDESVDTLNIDSDDEQGGDGDPPEKEDRGDDFQPDEEELLASDEEKDEAGEAVDKADDKTETEVEDEDKGEAKEKPASAPKNVESTEVPKSRFDDVNGKMKTYRDRLIARGIDPDADDDDAPAATATPAPAPVATQEEEEGKQLRELLRKRRDAELIDDDDEVLEINMQIEAMNRKVATRHAVEEVRHERVKKDYADALAQVVSDHPQLDANSPQADADAMFVVTALRDRIVKSNGGDYVAALREAVNKYTGVGHSTSKAEESVDSSKTKMDELKARRQRQALEKASKTSMNQPPALAGGVGERGRKSMPDVENMTDEEYNSLPVAEKRRLRGDSLA